MKFIFTILIIVSSLDSFGKNQQPISLGICFVSPADPYKFESRENSLKVFIDSTLEETINGNTPTLFCEHLIKHRYLSCKIYTPNLHRS